MRFAARAVPVTVSGAAAEPTARTCDVQLPPRSCKMGARLLHGQLPVQADRVAEDAACEPPAAAQAAHGVTQRACKVLAALREPCAGCARWRARRRRTPAGRVPPPEPAHAYSDPSPCAARALWGRAGALT